MTFFDTDLWRLSVFQTSQPLCNIVQSHAICRSTICIFAIDIDMYIQSSVSVPQPEFIVVSYIVTSGIRAKKGDLPIIQRRLIVTSSDILYKLWIPCREGDQYLLYLHLQHNITSFICANEGESVVVYPNISSVILRDEPEMLCIIPYQSTFQWIPETITKYSWGQTKSEYIDIKWNISIRISYQLYARSILCISTWTTYIESSFT